MYTSFCPTINVHGETKDTVKLIVETFIKDNQKMGKLIVGIIHGYSSHILKDEIKLILSKNKMVEKFYVDPLNPGLTIVYIKELSSK